VQQRSEKCPISRGEPDLLAVQVPFEDRDLVPEREDFGVLSRSLIGSSRNSARASATPSTPVETAQSGIIAQSSPPNPGPAQQHPQIVIM
jgi:hypothetical protein